MGQGRRVAIQRRQVTGVLLHLHAPNTSELMTAFLPRGRGGLVGGGLTSPLPQQQGGLLESATAGSKVKFKLWELARAKDSLNLWELPRAPPPAAVQPLSPPGTPVKV